MTFYNVVKQVNVEVSEDNFTKVHRMDYDVFAICAIDDDGTKMTKFIDKETYDNLNCQIRNIAKACKRESFSARIIHKLTPFRLFLKHISSQDIEDEEN